MFARSLDKPRCLFYLGPNRRRTKQKWSNTTASIAKLIIQIARDESGAGALDYLVLAALILGVAAGAIVYTGVKLSSVYDLVSESVSSAASKASKGGPDDGGPGKPKGGSDAPKEGSDDGGPDDGGSGKPKGGSGKPKGPSKD